MKSNQRYIDKARKNAVVNFDEKKLNYIQLNSKLNWLSHNTLFDSRFSTPNKIRLPDLVIKGTPLVILEHDSSKLHGELGYENERTQKRNHDYYKANMPFFVINEDLSKMLKLDEASLATYLYYHTLSQWRSYQL